MNDERLKQEIERTKQMISDYQRLKKVLKPTPEEYERQINILIDRLSNLLKKQS